MFSKIDKYIYRLLMENKHNSFVKKTNKLLNILEDRFNEDTLLIIKNDIEYILEDIKFSNIIESNVIIPPPEWISIGGIISVNKWNEICNKMKGDFNYHEALTMWKDWEAKYHKKERLKADGKIPMKDIVKERFKEELEADSNREYILITKNDNEEKSGLSYNEIPIYFYDKNSKIPIDFNSSLLFFKKNIKEYLKLTGRNMIYNAIVKLIHEKKVDQLSDNELKKIENKKDLIGVIISDNVLQEIMKRYYHALKSYRNKKSESSIIESYNIIESIDIDFDMNINNKNNFNFYSSILD